MIIPAWASSGAKVSKFSLTAMKRIFRRRKYCSMYSAALNHLNFLKNLCPNSSHIRYNIVVSILYLFANDYTNEQVAEYLVSIGYAQSMVQEYIRQLSSQSILELLPCILCPNCTDCEFSDLCCFDSECQILLQITQSK